MGRAILPKRNHEGDAGEMIRISKAAIGALILALAGLSLFVFYELRSEDWSSMANEYWRTHTPVFDGGGPDEAGVPGPSCGDLITRAGTPEVCQTQAEVLQRNALRERRNALIVAAAVVPVIAAAGVFLFRDNFGQP
jgi:hypothetical protein